jgi:hypothetical protein
MKRPLLVLILIVAVFADSRRSSFCAQIHTATRCARGTGYARPAEYVARTRPGHRVLVVSNPSPSVARLREVIETEEAGIRGLRNGFGKGVTVEAVVYPELKPRALEDPRSLITDPETATPLSYLVAPDALDRLAREHSDCDIIVSLIGLPADLSACETWQAGDARSFVLLFRTCASSATLLLCGAP